MIALEATILNYSKWYWSSYAILVKFRLSQQNFVIDARFKKSYSDRVSKKSMDSNGSMVSTYINMRCICWLKTWPDTVAMTV